MKMKKMERAMIDAQKKSEIATEKLTIVDFYKDFHNL